MHLQLSRKTVGQKDKYTVKDNTLQLMHLQDEASQPSWSFHLAVRLVLELGL